MKLKVFYNKKQSNMVTNTPSSEKAELLINQMLNNSYAKKIDVVSDFNLCSKEDICLAHDSMFVHNIFNLKKPTGYNTRSEDLNILIQHNISSFVEASLYAYENKTVTFSPTSGFHHATYTTPMHFCTFNGLIIACQKLRLLYGLKKIVILDFDAHYGNGNDDIIETLKLDYIEHVSFTKEFEKHGAKYLIDNLEDILFTRVDNADIILYQAGADPHINDPLGGFLSTEQMLERDFVIFELARDLDIPLVWNLAGGYQNDIQKVLDLHMNTIKAFFSKYRDFDC